MWKVCQAELAGADSRDGHGHAGAGSKVVAARIWVGRIVGHDNLEYNFAKYVSLLPKPMPTYVDQGSHPNLSTLSYVRPGANLMKIS